MKFLLILMSLAMLSACVSEKSNIQEAENNQQASISNQEDASIEIEDCDSKAKKAPADPEAIDLAGDTDTGCSLE